MADTDKKQQSLKMSNATAAPLKSALKKSKAVSDTKSTKKPRASSPQRNSSPARLGRFSVNKTCTTKPKVARNAPTPPPTKSNTKVDKGKTKAEPEAYPSTFKIVAGSYEKLLYGLEGSFFGEDGTVHEKPTLKPIFIFPAHIACVKAVAASPEGGKWLATGSTDEIIKVWDLRRRKEIGGLIQHEGSITYLDFPSRSYLISASEDGTICMFRARDWVLLRAMRGHKGRVNCIAVHPSGKVGLSVGKDRTLRMWDLMRGKGSASTKLGKEGELVRWSSNGDRFVVQAGSTLDVYSVDMALLYACTHPKRIQDVRFHKTASGREILLVAAEDKKVTIYGTEGSESTSLPIVAEVVGHGNRVKAIDTLAVRTPHHSAKQSWTTIMTTVSSDGWIRVFDLGALDSLDSKDVKILESIAGYDTNGSRLTCCALADGEASTERVTGKRKHEEDLESEDGLEDGTERDGEELGENGVANDDGSQDEDEDVHE